MSKTLIGLLFILSGVLYGSMAIDDIYNHTLGWLVKHGWINPPLPAKDEIKNILGRKPTILLYASILIIIGIFIIWNRNT